MITEHRIHSVEFLGLDALQVTYLTPTQDLKRVGLVRLHTLVVPRSFDYDDEIQAIQDAIVHLVNDVDEDWDNLDAGPVDEEEVGRRDVPMTP